MNSVQMEKALDEVLRDYRKTDYNTAQTIRHQISCWYYTSAKLTAEQAIDLLLLENYDAGKSYSRKHETRIFWSFLFLRKENQKWKEN